MKTAKQLKAMTDQEIRFQRDAAIHFVTVAASDSYGMRRVNKAMAYQDLVEKEFTARFGY